MQPEAVTPHGVTRADLYAALRQAQDPVYHMNVVELGLIAGVAIGAEAVIIDLYVPYTDTVEREELLGNVSRALQGIPHFPGGAIREIPGAEWDTSRISPQTRKRLGFEV
jgi:metal-sulfur cluster biosynthetic enzyme